MSDSYKNNMTKEGGGHLLPEVTVNVAIPSSHRFKVRPGPASRTRSQVSQVAKDTAPEQEDTEMADSKHDTIIMSESESAYIDVDGDGKDEFLSLDGLQNRKPGRPPGNPVGHVSVKVRKKKEAERRHALHIKKLLKDHKKGKLPTGQAWERFKVLEEDKEKELRVAPSNDLVAMTMEESIKIFKIGAKSKNLNGKLAHNLYEAAATMRAAAIALRERVDKPSSPSDEVAALRSQVEDLTRKVQALEAERADRGFRPTPEPPVEENSMDCEPMLPPSLEAEEEKRVTRGTARRNTPGEEPNKQLPRVTRNDRAGVSQSQPVVYRPAIKGVRKPLDTHHPPGLSIEKRESYDAITRQIDALVDSRQKMMESGYALAPPLAPQPAPAAPRTMPTEGAASAPNNTGSGKGSKKRKKKAAPQAPLPTARPTENAPSRRKAPKVPPLEAHPKGTAAGPKKASKGRGKSSPVTPSAIKEADNKIPAPSQTQPEVGWNRVVGRKERRAEKAKVNTAAGGPAASKASTPLAAATKTKAKRQKRRVPRTAAISLFCPEGTYTDAMRSVKTSINLEDLGIGVPKMRKGVTGALILEIAGEECGPKADALAARMSAILAGKEGVRVTRPQKRADLRLSDVDDSTTEAEVAAAVAAVGGCDAAEIKVGAIKRFPSRMGTVWVQCPVAAANKVAAAKKVKLGWTLARAEMLEARSLQCFRCLERGHTQANCPGGPDRSECCFRCGEKGHLANGCNAPIRCPVCTSLGRKADHRVGSRLCTSPKRKQPTVLRPATSASQPTTSAPGQPTLVPQPGTSASQPLKLTAQRSKIAATRGTAARRTRAKRTTECDLAATSPTPGTSSSGSTIKRVKATPSEEVVMAEEPRELTKNG